MGGIAKNAYGKNKEDVDLSVVAPLATEAAQARASATKRPDIQGLRALAVLLVVLYHLWPQRLSGGYVGVDVFFVISGYLITAHLLAEVARTGTVKVGRFWARRIRRLLPAAFTVLGVSLIAALAFIPKAQLQQTLVEIGASTIYAQNWILSTNSIDYLAEDNVPSLVQHYWSLSVEEQFYILWPLLILAALFVAKKMKLGKAGAIRAIGVALGLVIVASFAFSVFETARSQPSAYFITTTRAWEFALGGVLAFVPARFGVGGVPQWLSRSAVWLGLAFIAVSAISYDARTSFPGYLAILPVVGTMLALQWGDSTGKYTFGRLSKFGPIQFLGDISYAVYLWHWPLIVLYPCVVGQDLSMIGRVAILALTIVLATVTKVFIEDPVRDAKGWMRSPAAAYGFMAIGVLAIVGVVVVASVQLDRQRELIASSIADAASSGIGCFGAAAMDPVNDCSDPFAVTDTVDPAFATADVYWGEGSAIANGICAPAEGELLARCEFGETATPSLTLALIGDSHAQHVAEPFARAAEAKGWRLLPYMRARCTSLENRAQIDARKLLTPDVAEDIEACYLWSQAALEEIATRDDIDVVVFSYRGGVDAEQTAELWRQIEATGKRVVALGDVPPMPESMPAPDCVEKQHDQYDPCAWSPDPSKNLARDAAALAAVPYIELASRFCADGTCHAVVGGTIVYFDDNHFSLRFSRSLTPFIGTELEKVVSGSS